MADTLLNYDVSPQQFKIGTTAELLIMVSPRRVADVARGPGRHRTVHKQVFVEEITIDFGDMGGTADLTGSPALIETSTPQGWTQVKNDWIFGPLKGWTFKRSGGKFVARATADAGMMGPHSVIMLKLTKIAVGPYGTADLVITEKASIDKDEEKQVRTNPSIPLNKRNPFHVGPLMVDKTHVEKGGKVVVHWAGSSDANYSLGWKADNGEWFDAKLLDQDGQPVKDKDGQPYAGVPPAGSYAVTDLQSDKVFTLTYKHGGTTGIKPVSVSVIDPQPTIRYFRSTENPVVARTAVTLEWAFEYVDTFELVETDAHGTRSIVIPSSSTQCKVTPELPVTTYLLTAKNKGINMSAASTVQVNLLAPVPVGTIMAYYDVQKDAEKDLEPGWLMCDGRTFDQATYPKLYRSLGYSNVCPNLCGQFLRGLDKTGTVDPDGKNRTVGTEQKCAIQRHLHDVALPIQSPEAKYNSGFAAGDPIVYKSFPTMESGGDETRPTNIAVYYIIFAGVPAT